MASTQECAPALYELGEHYIKLGEALQNSKTTLPELVVLADNCGLELGIAIVPRIVDNELEEEGRPG